MICTVCGEAITVTGLDARGEPLVYETTGEFAGIAAYAHARCVTSGVVEHEELVIINAHDEVIRPGDILTTDGAPVRYRPPSG